MSRRGIAKTFDRAADFYQKLHEGLPPKRLVRQEVPQPRRRGRRMLGYIEQIQYEKETLTGEFAYWHPHERHAQPELWRDGRGNLYAWGCNYVVTDRGIEDMPEGRFTGVCQNLTPKRLVTLGRLSWIRYRSPNGSSKILKFEGAARKILAVDETQKLHFLGGAKVEAAPMARRRRRSRRSFAARFNAPGGGMMSKAKKYGLAFLATGAGVFVGLQAINFVSTKLPAMSPYVRAAAKAAIGLGAGIAAYMYAPRAIAPTLGTALGAGGMFAGVSDAYATFRLSSGRGTAGLFSLPAGRRAAAGNAFARNGSRVAA